MGKRARKSVEGLTFSRGFVVKRDRVWILSEKDDVAKAGTPHTKLLIYKQGQWTHRIVSWGSVAICGKIIPDIEGFIIGPEGEVLRGTPTGFLEEVIDDSADGPTGRGELRDARYIGRRVFVVGMSRQAYRRDTTGIWNRIDTDILAEPLSLVGLNSVDGLSEEAVYSVGLKGEIWYFDGRSWKQQDSPTNITLNRIRCVSPDGVYVCGMGGVILRGNGKQFDFIEQDLTEDNFYGLEWFQGKLYVAALTGLYVLDKERFSVVDFNLGDGATTGDLQANDGVLWSFGAKHLAYTEDGVTWTQVFCT